MGNIHVNIFNIFAFHSRIIFNGEKLLTAPEITSVPDISSLEMT